MKVNHRSGSILFLGTTIASESQVLKLPASSSAIQPICQGSRFPQWALLWIKRSIQRDGKVWNSGASQVLEVAVYLTFGATEWTKRSQLTQTLQSAFRGMSQTRKPETPVD